VYKIGVVGGTGYTGVELLRILAAHSEVELVVITSRGDAGTLVADMFPNLRGHIDLAFTHPDEADFSQCDLVFFATPHAVSMNQVPELLAQGIKVVDLSADFRLKDVALWEQWYGPHVCPELLSEAVYGLPEFYAEQIAQARLVAAPGCYPTSIELGFAPLLNAGVIDKKGLIADAKTGVSGGGKQAKLGFLFSEAGDSLKAYGVSGHRHLPEIKQVLSDLCGEAIDLTFVPHLAPMIRGIHATLYADLLDESADLQAIFEDFYQDSPFVDVMPAGSLPDTRSVRGSNYCRLAVYRPQGGNKVVILSVIDNLTKGSSGQAVQAMNLMLGLDQSCGLTAVALIP